MKIEVKNQKEAYVYKVPLIAEDERFFFVPGASDYALSTYGRLYKKVSDGKWERQKIFYSNADSYKILYDFATEEKTETIESLVKQVFFTGKEIFKIYNPDYNPEDEKRWDIKKLYALSRQEYMYVLQCKMKHKKPELEEKPIITYLYTLPIRSKLQSLYSGMKTRACNVKYKKRFPRYQNVIMCDDWKKNPTHAKEYILSRWYYYPEQLVMDKDLMTLGMGNCYAPDFTVPLPYKYNNIFCESNSELGYGIQQKTRINGNVYYIVPGSMFKDTKSIICDTYEDALKAARQRKATYIRSIIEEEKHLGYMPLYILEKMEVWAAKCEAGELLAWEPRINVLEKMGVIA